MKIALATCRELPEPDLDQVALADALNSAGAEASWQAWDDPGVSWGAFDLCVLRSTWDYPERPHAFAAWAERAAAATRLLNPLEAVRWNIHKRYLLELEARAFPIVPTHLVSRGARCSLAERMRSEGWSTLVVKPAISAASRLTIKVTPTTLAAGQEHFEALLAEEDVLLQPFLPAIEVEGERSVIFIDGALSHAIRKRPRFSGEAESVEGPIVLSPVERALALEVFSTLPYEGLLYGRVDLVTGPAGTPVVMELELIEPSLYLLEHPPALEALVAAVLARA